MNKVATLPLLCLPALGLLALTACGSSAHNEAAEAGSTIAADPNATMAEAIKDVDAAGAADKAAEPGNAADIGDVANEIQD